MKKLLLTLTILLAVSAGSVFAQAAPAADSKKEKTEVKKSPEDRKPVIATQAKNRAAMGAKAKAGKPMKAKVKNHKDEIQAHDASQAEVKEHAMEQHADHKEAAKKDKIAAHKDEIKSHADSKQEAKAKLQRKHDKHKDE